jgi:hypothetical protein
MPYKINRQTKKDTDARYRKKQRETKGEEYHLSRRAITKKSEAKWRENATDRDKRNRRRQRTQKQREYRARKKAEAATSMAQTPKPPEQSTTPSHSSIPSSMTPDGLKSSAVSSHCITRKALAAVLREKKKKEEALAISLKRNDLLQREVWRLKKRISRVKVNLSVGQRCLLFCNIS